MYVTPHQKLSELKLTYKCEDIHNWDFERWMFYVIIMFSCPTIWSADMRLTELNPPLFKIEIWELFL